MSSLGSLLSEHCDLTRAWQEARAACRHAANDNHKHVRNSQWKLQGTIRNVALIIYTLCDFEELPVVVYLRGVGATRRWPSLPDGDVVKLFQDLFLSVDLGEVVALTSSGDSSDAVAMSIAMKTVREWRVVRWGLTLNACGVAPSTCELLRKADTLLPPSARTKTKTGRPTRSARTWASRCRFEYSVVVVVGL